MTFATNTVAGTPSNIDTINVTSATGGDSVVLGSISAPSSGGGPSYPFIINNSAPVTIGTFFAGSFGNILTFTGTTQPL